MIKFIAELISSTENSPEKYCKNLWGYAIKTLLSLRKFLSILPGREGSDQKNEFCSENQQSGRENRKKSLLRKQFLWFCSPKQPHGDCCDIFRFYWLKSASWGIWKDFPERENRYFGLSHLQEPPWKFTEATTEDFRAWTRSKAACCRLRDWDSMTVAYTFPMW